MPRRQDANQAEIRNHARRTKQILQSLDKAGNTSRLLHGHLTKLNAQAEKMAMALGKSKNETERNSTAHSLLGSVSSHVRFMASVNPLTGKDLRSHRAEVKKTLPHLRAAIKAATDLQKHLRTVTEHTSKI